MTLMDPTHLLPMALAVAFVAALYASVGHGGASGYLAIMALLAFPPSVMKPTALLLNLLVAGIGAVQYYRAGHLKFSLLWPFAVTSIPMSYIGARLHISPKLYEAVLGVTLLWAGLRMIVLRNHADVDQDIKGLPGLPAALGIGAAVGLLSGMVGVGGGIFLSPLFILMRWARAKETAAISAAFIWVNSAAGMVGNLHSGVHWPNDLWVWAAAAVAGGLAGSSLGAWKWSGLTLRRVLAVVLVFAAVKAFMPLFT